MTQPPEVHIRHASLSDLEAVGHLLAAAFEPYAASYTPDAFRDTVPTRAALAQRFRDMTVLVAEDNTSTIVGTVSYGVSTSGNGHLRGMAVVLQHQGSGIAQQLLHAAEAELKEGGCTLVTLDTTRPLERATRFYLRRGYEATGRVTDIFGMELIEYAKSLREQAT